MFLIFKMSTNRHLIFCVESTIRIYFEFYYTDHYTQTFNGLFDEKKIEISSMNLSLIHQNCSILLTESVHACMCRYGCARTNSHNRADASAARIRTCTPDVSEIGCPNRTASIKEWFYLFDRSIHDERFGNGYTFRDLEIFNANSGWRVKLPTWCIYLRTHVVCTHYGWYYSWSKNDAIQILFHARTKSSKYHF